MNTNQAPPRVVVVGAGADLALVAYSVANKLRHLQPAVMALNIGGRSGGSLVSTFSDMKSFNDSIGISEKAFINGVGAGVNFGFALSGASSEQPFIFSDSPYGLVMHHNQFHQLFHIYRQVHPNARLDDFCLPAILAKAGKFAPRSSQSNSVFSTISYGYTFSVEAYERFFRRMALRHNVTFVSSNDISVDEKGGVIDKLVTRAGQVLEADLYIDCSHERALVAKRGENHGAYSLESSYVLPWRYRAQDVVRPEIESHQLYARLDATPLGHERQIVHGQTLSTEVFEYQSRAGNSGVDAEYRQASALRRPWDGNCVAVGAACLEIPSLLPGAYNILQGQLLQLMDIWCGNPKASAAADIFNDASAQMVSHALDLVNIHLGLHPQLSVDVRLTEANRSRVELFASSGALFQSENAIVTDQHWAALLFGLGVAQREGSLQVSSLDQHKAVHELDKLKTLLQRAAEAAQPYKRWLDENGGAQ